jgi:hypothetical protein
LLVNNSINPLKGFTMNALTQFASIAFFAVAASSAYAAPATSNQPFIYGKGEASLIVNPAASTTKATENVGASMEQLLVVGKGEAGAMVNPKAIQSKDTNSTTAQFESAPGELGIVMKMAKARS